MPWKKLLENERCFPNQLLLTSTIIAFLEKWQDGQKTGNPCIKAVISNWCSLKPDRVLDSELDSIIKKMTNMKFCQLPGSDDVVKELRSDVESLKGSKLTLKPFNKITFKLESLRDRAPFFRWLGSKKFNSVIHCEANLACLMMLCKDAGLEYSEYKQIVDELSVSCIISTPPILFFLCFI